METLMFSGLLFFFDGQELCCCAHTILCHPMQSWTWFRFHPYGSWWKHPWLSHLYICLIISPLLLSAIHPTICSTAFWWCEYAWPIGSGTFRKCGHWRKCVTVVVDLGGLLLHSVSTQAGRELPYSCLQIPVSSWLPLASGCRNLNSCMITACTLPCFWP